MGFSAKHFEIMNYEKYGFNEELIKKTLADLPCQYAYILHDKDVYTEEDEKKNPEHKAGHIKDRHWHVYVNFGKTSWSSANIAKRFEVEENYVSKVKGRKGDMLAYLTHENALEKVQYSAENVISNFEWEKIKKEDLNLKDAEIRADEIRDAIVSGEWRDFNIHKYVTAKEFQKFSRVIDKAFEYRIRTLRGADRDMRATYIYGDSGTGKTTLAKIIAEEKGYSIYVSSGSNDVLDDYKGEDCIILDDLRPSAMGLSDLLKMLDSNTSSTVRSRYRNKVLECKMIIITTTLPIEQFFKNVFDSQDETAVQLMRRCETLFKLTTDYMYPYVWQKKSRKYMPLPKLENPVASKFKSVDLSIDEAQDLIFSMLGNSVPRYEQMELDGYDEFKSALNGDEVPF